MNEIKCPYLGCGKKIQYNADTKTCPHCGRIINIAALTREQDDSLIEFSGATVMVFNRPMDYIENPDKE